MKNYRVGKAIGGITKISKILKQTFKPRGRKPGVLDKVIGKGVVDKNVKSKELKKLFEKSKARSKERVAESKLKKKRTKGLATGAVIGGAYKLGEEKGKGKK